MAVNVPTVVQVKARLTKLLPSAVSFVGTIYRSCTPRYANGVDLLTGAGSQRNGGRWNPAGIAVIYASLTPETAMAETLAHNRYYGIALQDAMPRTFVAIQATLQTVLDLRDGPVRQRLQISLDRILNVDWRKDVQAGILPITQTIGQAVFELGLEGLIVPSAADKTGHNLLIFPTNLLTESMIKVLNTDRLPN